MTKPRQPAVAGWFDTVGDRCRLIGTRCARCATVFFPRRDAFCGNPHCAGTEFDEIELSDRGVVWSYTSVNYQPPEPFVTDPNAEWEPYVLLAVELEAERMLVLGQAPPGVTVADVEVGMPVRITSAVLYEEGGTVYTTWNFAPLHGEGEQRGEGGHEQE